MADLKKEVKKLKKELQHTQDDLASLRAWLTYVLGHEPPPYKEKPKPVNVLE